MRHLSFSEYQIQAHRTSFLDTVDDPAGYLGAKIDEELRESMTEKPLMYLSLFDHDVGEIDDATKSVVAKEFGDVLWCLAERYTIRDQHFGHVAIEVLQDQGSLFSTTAPDMLTLQDFDIAAADCAGKMTVCDHKMACFMEAQRLHNKKVVSEADREQAVNIRLDDLPGYVYKRLSSSMNRQLDYELGREGVGPPWGNADLEAPNTHQRAPGRLIMAMSWIAQEFLGTSLNDIAVANLGKLAQRMQDGTLVKGQGGRT